MYRDGGTPETAGSLDFVVEKSDVNVIDAAARGASEGLMLALNVGAMLLAFVALIQLCNGILGWAGGFVGWDGITLEAILGWLLAPLAWLMGVSWADATEAGPRRRRRRAGGGPAVGCAGGRRRGAGRCGPGDGRPGAGRTPGRGGGRAALRSAPE